MKLTINSVILLLSMVSLLLTGCAGDPITIKSISSKDIILSNSRQVSGEACGFQLLLFIPISINSRLERAYSELQKNAGFNKLANVSIEESWYYAAVGTIYCTKLNAVAYQNAVTK